jgi:hypothetical protein
MSNPLTISLDEEEEPVFKEEEAAPALPPKAAPRLQAAPRPEARDWKECLLELLKTAPPEEVSRMFNKEYLKEVLKEIAQGDPLLRLFFLLYG